MVEVVVITNLTVAIYGTIDMSRYKIMWCYMLSTLTKDKIEKKGGGGAQMTLLIGRLGARKTYSSALAMELRLSWINPSISSLPWVWWVVTKKYGEHSSLLCENAVLINMTDRLQGSVLVCAQPMRDVVTINVKMSLMGWAHTQTDPLDSECEILSLSLG